MPSVPARVSARSRGGLLVLAVLLVTACSDGPTEPDVPVHVAPAEEVNLFLPNVTDVTARILPTLRDQSAAQAIGAALGELGRQLAGRDGQRAVQALAAARAAVAAYGPGSDAATAEAPELDVIRLTLYRASMLLGLD